MELTVNGKTMEVESGLSLLDLIKVKGLEPDRVVVEYNAQIVKKEEWNTISLKENDRLEILRFVGGG